MHESGSPHNGHASVVASPYLYASLPLYSCPYRNLRIVMPSLGGSAYACVKSCAYVSGAGTPCYGCEDESSVKGGVIETFKCCGSYFLSEVFGGVCESMHT